MSKGLGLVSNVRMKFLIPCCFGQKLLNFVASVVIVIVRLFWDDAIVNCLRRITIFFLFNNFF